MNVQRCISEDNNTVVIIVGHHCAVVYFHPSKPGMVNISIQDRGARNWHRTFENKDRSEVLSEVEGIIFARIKLEEEYRQKSVNKRMLFMQEVAKRMEQRGKPIFA